MAINCDNVLWRDEEIVKCGKFLYEDEIVFLYDENGDFIDRLCGYCAELELEAHPNWVEGPPPVPIRP